MIEKVICFYLITSRSTDPLRCLLEICGQIVNFRSGRRTRFVLFGFLVLAELIDEGQSLTDSGNLNGESQNKAFS